MQLKTLLASNDQIDDNSCKSVTVCDILIVDELVTLGESPKCDPTTKYVKFYSKDQRLLLKNKNNNKQNIYMDLVNSCVERMKAVFH